MFEVKGLFLSDGKRVEFSVSVSNGFQMCSAVAMDTGSALIALSLPLQAVL